MLLDYMRRNTQRFLIITIALVVPAFIFWGTMPSLGQKSGADTLIKIGDQKVTLEQFSNRYQTIREITRLRLGSEYTPELEKLLNLKQQAIDAIIREALFAREADRLGIIVSDEEVQDALKRDPAFYTDGKFDPAKWNRLLASPQVNAVVANEREQLRDQKLVDMITAEARVTENEVHEEYLRQNEKVKIEFTGFNASDLMGEVHVSEDDMNAYYERHKQQYAEPAQVKLAYVQIKKEPSPADYEAVKSIAQSILDRIRAGDDFAGLAKYSDDAATRDKGGDLGFIKRGQMPKEFEDVAFSLKPGEVSDLVRTQNGFQIIKVEETRGEGSNEEVHVRHILSKVEPSQETLDSLEEKAMRLSVNASQTPLDKAAPELGLTVEETPLFPETSPGVPGLGVVREVTDILPGLEVGRPSDIISTQKAFYVIEVTERVPEHIPDMDKVKDKVKSAVTIEKALALAKSKAENILTEINEKGVVPDKIESVEFKQATPFSRRGYPRELPYISDLVNAVFDLPEGGAAGPFVGDNTAYVVVLEKKIEPDPAGYDSDKETIRKKLLAERMQQVFEDYYENLREKAGVQINDSLLNKV